MEPLLLRTTAHDVEPLRQTDFEVPAAAAAAADPSNDTAAAASGDFRRRHQSEFHSQRPSPSRYLPGSSARDDYDLRRQMSAERLSQGARGEDVSSSSKDPTKPVEIPGKLESLLDEQKQTVAKKPDLCACWCSGWAEVKKKRS